MKSRKGKKKKNGSILDCHNLSSSSNLDESKNDASQTNISLCDDTEFPKQFMILLDQKFASKLKTSHAAFLHPSIIQAYGSPWYFFIEGQQKAALCVAYPLKSVKRPTIVLPNSYLGFTHQELVILHPYVKQINCAVDVKITLNDETYIDKNAEEIILDVLSSTKFFYSGMKLEFKSSINTCEFTITEITKDETFCDLQQSTNENNLTSICNDSLNNFEHSSSQLALNFSSMCLNNEESDNYKDSFCHSRHFRQDAEIHSNSVTPNFFTLNYNTKLSVQSNKNDTKNVTSFPYFKNIGGLKQEILNIIKSFIDMSLHCEEKSDLTTSVLLFSGPSGTGKTMMLEAVRNEYDANTEEILWSDLYAKTLTEAEQELRDIFQRARNGAPSIIFVDDFNYLIPTTSNHWNEISRILSQEIRRCIGLKVIIIAAVNSSNYDTEILKSWDIMVEEIKFVFPDFNQREDIILKLLVDKVHNLSSDEIKEFALNSQGFSGKDLKDVLNDAITYKYLNSRDDLSSNEGVNGRVLTFLEIRKILKQKRPTVIESETKIKKVRWNDIGGMPFIKEMLKDIVEGPLKHPDIYKRFDVKPSRGVLLYGPPGCSKTMIAKALATECDLNFISKNVSDIHNKYVGESEKAVSDLFLMARANSPCIVFLDEIDALIPSRGSSTGSGVEERVVNTFLQEIDGIEELNNVIIIAATNRPDRIDEAFLRYGRINHYIYVPLPDLQARKEIFKLQMKKRLVAADFDYKYLAQKTEGYSGAEIVNLCNEAALELLTEDFECQTPVFKMKYFEKAFKTIKPRTSRELLEFYENFNSKFNVR